jgi:hypothetical protein
MGFAKEEVEPAWVSSVILFDVQLVNMQEHSIRVSCCIAYSLNYTVMRDQRLMVLADL